MTTYGRLTTDVDSWLARDDLKAGSDIQTITRLAEANIARDIRTVAQERNTTLVAASRQNVAPDGFLAARFLDIDSNQTPRIDYMTPEVLRKHRAWSNGSNIMFYTLEGKIGDEDDEDVYFTWAPAGAAANPVNVELGYWRRFSALENSGDTNWLLTNNYDVYLFAILEAASIFLQEAETAAAYNAMYESVKTKLNRSENNKRFRGQTKKGYNSPRPII